jgi:hypothetical protein
MALEEENAKLRADCQALEVQLLQTQEQRRLR